MKEFLERTEYWIIPGIMVMLGIVGIVVGISLPKTQDFAEAKSKYGHSRLNYRCSESGVEYITNFTGLALHVDKNGKPVPCSGEK